MLIYSHYIIFFTNFVNIHQLDNLKKKTIVKTHNEKIIDHAKLHTKQQK